MECNICNHKCSLAEGKIGVCHARTCHESGISELGYGKLSYQELLPIEAIPISMYKKGSKILTIGGFGCNMKCPFCNTAEVSQSVPDDSRAIVMTPEMIVKSAMAQKLYGNIGLCFSYNEPMVGYEYVRDCARYAEQLGMDCILKTNGCTDEKMSAEIYKQMNAINIDLKTMRKSLYKAWGGDRDTVLANIYAAYECTHLELTVVIIPGVNDTEEEMIAMSKWIAKLDKDIPLHIMRYYPRHKMKDVWSTSDRSIASLTEVARRKLTHVSTYIG